jgi:hypothetical protein
VVLAIVMTVVDAAVWAGPVHPSCGQAERCAEMMITRDDSPFPWRRE